MKQLKSTLIIFLSLLLLSGCGTPAAPEVPEAPEAVTAFTDALGYSVSLSSWDRVVSLYGSFAEVWTLAGGKLVGTTSDALEERGLDVGPDAVVVGSVKEPNLEEILAADPDFVILAADIAAQVDLHDALTQAGIPHAYYRTDTFAEYLSMLGQFCSLTGRDDLYEQNGLSVQRQIDRVLDAVQDQPRPSALLIRAYTTGAKAKGDDNLAGVILRDLGGDNLVSRHESLLEDISLEEVIAADPDFILVATMGNQDAAMAYMSKTFESNPAWAGLSAVQNGRYVLLPQELFHYKPNARWGESYAYLAKILYPELAADLA
ncbi:ABC transporter substrate-binding protein [Oscillibacter sp.]|uniref:ABC transporter substrate-binding protein n=1 Tax=Oscillibacter sp. TaxID=1945593 RepID=UPI002637A832|nr:ABC transporter substrate-binding protein [Oscillibacter sp.]MDD3346739.1 ABC transporter substrate-binding protein [Oscillibacter sp.]